MRIWFSKIADPTSQYVDVSDTTINIGSDSNNHVQLKNKMVAPQAIRLYRDGEEWKLIYQGLSPCRIGGHLIEPGKAVTLFDGQVIEIAIYTLQVEFDVRSETDDARQVRQREELMWQLIRTVHLRLLEVMDLDHVDPQQDNNTYLFNLERNLEEIVREPGQASEADLGLILDHAGGACLRGELILSIASTIESNLNQRPWASLRPWSRLRTALHDRELELKALQKEATQKLQLGGSDDATQQANRIEQGFWSHWQRRLPTLTRDLREYLGLRYLKKQIKDIIFGYGPLEDLLVAPNVSEIMVVDRDHIYVEKSGIVEDSGRRFLSNQVTEAIIQRIVAPLGRRIDRSTPLVDARLADGSRVNAVIPPLAIKGPCLTIRKFPVRRLRLADLLGYGCLNDVVAEFLRAAVRARKNILIAGGTGTGKTTLLNCLSDFIPAKERIITVEDTAELQLNMEHVVRLETRPANVEGSGAYSIRDLVRNALRMRPDRIIVGECRGPEALDMLQAMNTGHDGSMTTLHANSTRDVLLRLEVLVLMAADLPVTAIHRQIGAALDLSVQLSRLRDGRRVVSQVSEFVGWDPETGSVRTKDLFVREGDTPESTLQPTGILPTFMSDLIERKLIDLNIFYRR